MNILKRNIGIIFVLIFALIASVPLFHSGFYPMHDDEQIARLYDLNQALSEGQFPPRISPNLGFGYGYPFFNFYPSFAYYVGEIFLLFGFGYIVSTKLMLFVGFLLAAFFAYLLGKEIFGEEAGIVTSAFYTFAPYHAVDIYVRGAYAEFFSFVFLPFIFWSIQKNFTSRNKIFIALTAIGVCFLILSHNLIFLMASPFILLWIFYLAYKFKENSSPIFTSLAGVMLGFGASAYFSIPSFFERGYTLIRILTSELASYSLHFVCIRQLWNSPWGYGGSIASCSDGISFEVGKLALILSGLAIGLFVFIFIKKREKEINLDIPVIFIMLLISMFLTVKYSKPIWDSIILLSYIQFPWRFLTLAAMFSALLAGSVLVYVKKKRTRIVLMLVLIGGSIFFNYHFFTPQKHLNVSDSDYTNLKKLRWDTSSLAYEYVPATISTKKSQYDTTLVDITSDEIKKVPYKIVKGTMIVRVDQDKSTMKKFNVVASTKGTLRINTFTFPGWVIYIDGKKVEYSAKNKLALIDVEIPAGKHTVVATFQDTNVRMLGNLVSFISIIIICWIMFGSLKARSTKSGARNKF